MNLNKKQSLVAMAVLAGISAQPALADNYSSGVTWPPLAAGTAAAYTLAAACGYGNTATGTKSTSGGAESLAKKADAGKKKPAVARKKPKAEPAVVAADTATASQPTETGATLTLAATGETDAPAFSPDKSYADPAAVATDNTPAIAASTGDFSPNTSYADPAAAASSPSSTTDAVAGLLIPAASADANIPASATATATDSAATTETAKPKAKAKARTNGKAKQIAGNAAAKPASAASTYAYGGSGNCLVDMLQVAGKVYSETWPTLPTVNAAATPTNGYRKPGHQTVAWQGSR
jgi:hypothetical protein